MKPSETIKVIKETAEKKEISKKTSKFFDFFSPDSPTIKNITYVVIIIATVIIATLTLNKFLDANVLNNGWYWIIVGATAIICLIGWVQKKIQIESANTICKIVLAISILMLILNTIWPWTTLSGLREKLDKRPAVTTKVQPASWSDTLSMDEKIDTGLAVRNYGSFLITTDKDFYLVQGDGKWGPEHLVLVQGPVRNKQMTYSMGGGIWVKAKHPNTKVEIRTL
ncbi:MAG: hypothetical protein U9R14_03655 [Patescibacteria group bacterium]|nr:hypothetical protein [Patescibacteria group bacterium]